jgi:multidrug efflux pump
VGAGANARHSIGTGIIGGMLGETTLAMLYVPLLFYLFDQLAEGKGKDKNETGPAANHESTGDVATPPPVPQDGH